MKNLGFFRIMAVFCLFFSSVSFAADANELTREPNAIDAGRQSRRVRTAPEPKVPGRPTTVLTKIPLPEPDKVGTYGLEQVINKRRSIREFTDERLNIEQVSQLLWAAQGITEPGRGLRAAPSAGAIYPFEVYFIIPGGVYTYNPVGHTITKVITGDIRSELATASFRQSFIADAPINILLAGLPKKVMAKYSNRGRQYMYIEAGHIAQNVHLQAVALGLGSVPVGAFNDIQVKRLLRLKPGFDPVYLISVGYPEPEAAGEALEPLRSARQSSESGRRGPGKVVMIIPSERFDAHQFFYSRDVFEVAGYEIEVASTETGFIRSSHGGRVEAELLISDIRPGDYDGIFLIGGSPSRYLYRDAPSLGYVIREGLAQGKVVGAIGLAAEALAEADVVAGKVVTGPGDARDEMEDAGASFTGGRVEVSDGLVTGEGEYAATEFAKAAVTTMGGGTYVHESGIGRYEPEESREKRREFGVEGYQEDSKNRD